MDTLSSKQDDFIEYVTYLYGQRFTGVLVVSFDQGYPNKLYRKERLKTEELRGLMRKPVYVVKKKAQPVPGEAKTEEVPSGLDPEKAV